MTDESRQTMEHIVETAQEAQTLCRECEQMIHQEPDWRELYTETKATLLVRDAELHMARESNRILREREPVSAAIDVGFGLALGMAVVAWLVIG